jgi:hypothetical protein
MKKKKKIKKKEINMTYAIASAAGQDAANRQMRAAGRKKWNEDDWNLACEVMKKLFPQGKGSIITTPQPSRAAPAGDENEKIYTGTSTHSNPRRLRNRG